jgi:hypothetical protein
MNKQMINTCPDYQREISWKEENQKGLIDTLLDGFPMPSLNFCEDKSSEFRYECMDGKNRLKSIRLFMTDELKTNGKFFRDLTDDQRENFNNIQVNVCIFTDLSQEDRQDYFRRIQKGVILNQPELIWSEVDHPLMKQIRLIRNELFDEIKNLWRTKRYTDLQLFINIIHMIQGKNPTLQSSGLTDWIGKQSKNDDYTDVARKLKIVIRCLNKIVTSCPGFHQKLKAPFTFDLAHWIIKHDFREPNVGIISEFSSNIGKLIMNEDVNDEIARTYFTLLTVGASSYQYTTKTTTSRYQIISQLLD